MNFFKINTSSLRLLPSFLGGILLTHLMTACTSDISEQPLNDSYRNTQSDKGSANLESAKSTSLNHEMAQARADISSLNDSGISGTVRFTKLEHGVQVTADITGLSPGEHGFHIHEFGDCNSKNSDSIGAHYNPTHHKHGKPGSEDSHVGDLGNLVADENGNAHYEAINKVIKLQGRNSILGRSIIIHADRDDYTTQPTGASGLKIGCGVIEPSSD